jgi:hypothetical protein
VFSAGRGGAEDLRCSNSVITNKGVARALISRLPFIAGTMNEGQIVVRQAQRYPSYGDEAQAQYPYP